MPTNDSQASAPPSTDWADFRLLMPITKRWAYLDHAAVAPLPAPTRDALVEWLADASENGSANYLAWKQGLVDLRRLSGEFIGAAEDEIALVGSTTMGINYVSEGFPWKPGDNVVLRDDEFPSNQYPWMHLASRGVEVRRIPISADRSDLEQLLAAVDSRTKIVALSWVVYSNGWRHDLAAFADAVHRRGALLFVDAIQGLGVFPINVEDSTIDFLAADGHKWLLGPEGAGILYVRREHLNLLRPMNVGWNSVKRQHDFQSIVLDFKETGERYEGGSPNIVGFRGLLNSMGLLSKYPREEIARRICETTDYACERLKSRGARIFSDRTPERKSGILSFDLPGVDPDAFRRRCFEAGIMLSCRAGRLRISPHVYNNADDIDRLIEVLNS